MAYLVDLVSSLSDAAFAVDREARIVAWSAGAKELLGSAEDSVCGKRCGDVLQGVYPGGEMLCTALCEGHNCFKHEKLFSVEYCLLRHKDGRMIPVRINSLAVSPTPHDWHSDGAITVIFLQERFPQSAESAHLEPLRIFTLGHFSLVVGGRGLAIDTWKRKQALTVLKYLTANVDRPVHRERLIEYLWPEADLKTGWKRLKVTISYLRHQLHAGGVPHNSIVTVEESYLLRGDAVWIDSKEFEKQVVAGHALERRKRPEEALVCFEDAERLYGGDYLENDLYSDWCVNQRERLRELYFEMLAGLAKCRAELGDYVGSAKACREALYRDQGRESFLRSLIEALDKIDRADWAKPQLDIWQRVLTEEFGIVPKPEQLRFYREIIKAETRSDSRGNVPSTD